MKAVVTLHTSAARDMAAVGWKEGERAVETMRGEEGRGGGGGERAEDCEGLVDEDVVCCSELVYPEQL